MEFNEAFGKKEILKAAILFVVNNILLFWGSIPFTALNRLTINSNAINEMLTANGYLGSNFLIGLISFFICMILFGNTLKESFSLANKRKEPKRDILLIIIVAIAIKIGTRISYIIVDIVAKQAANNQIYAEEASQGNKWLFLALVVIFGPVVEEMIYRYGVYRLFEIKNRILAHAVSAGLFGLAHVWISIALGGEISQLLTILPYCVMGLGLSILYEKAGNIWYPIAMHSMFNLAGYI